MCAPAILAQAGIFTAAGGGRAAAHAGAGHILQAIEEFDAELAAIEARLSGLATEATSAQRRNDLRRDWTTT
jgi:hypothetical protein